MYRLLAIFHAHRFGLIKVKFVAKTSKMRFDYKLTTACAGKTVEIRWGRFVGRTREEVVWKEAVELLDSSDAPGLHRVSSLASGTVESQASASSGPSSSGRRHCEPDSAGGLFVLTDPRGNQTDIYIYIYI